MRKRTKILVAGAAAGAMVLVAIGGAVAGHRNHGDGHYSKGHGGGHYGMGHGGGHYGMHRGGHRGGKALKHLAKRYDADKDGTVSQAEIDTNRTEWHKKFDTDGNGTLSLKEFESLWLEAKRQRMVRSFQRFDVDGDAQMTLEEYTEPMSNIVERWDRNGDGVISREDRRHGHGMKHHKKHEMKAGDSQ